MKVEKPDYVLDISQLKELDYISESDGMLHIGANTTFATLEKNELISEYYPAIAKWQIIWVLRKLENWEQSVRHCCFCISSRR